MSFNLAVMLRESARSTPDKPALFWAGGDLTYADLDRSSTEFANGLRAAGLSIGDVVCAQLPNCPEFLVAYFGTLKAGMTFLPINPLLTTREVIYHLEDSGAKLVIGFAMVAVSTGEASASTGVPLYLVGGGGAPGHHGFDELLGDESVHPVYGDIAPTAAEATAVLVYTSGTTGKPKGAMLSHFQMYSGCDITGNLFGMRADDVALGVLPFFHVFGLCTVINTGVRFGASIVVLPRFEVTPVMDAVEKYRVSVVSGVPTMLQAMLADTEERDLSALRVAISGGASLPGAVMEQFEEKFKIWVLEGYGLTETSAVASFNRSLEERKVLSIGVPMWGADMRIVDGDGSELPRGPENVGEIVIRGPSVMTGYLGRPEATAETFKDGWFHSGDLGYRDEDGYFFIVDRSKDLIIRGGYNVYPREIEEVLFAHPQIAEAAVIGKPDERLGEEVVAVIALIPDSQLTAEDIVAYTKTQLAAYKYPREIRFVTELPKGPTGKILKAELRK